MQTAACDLGMAKENSCPAPARQVIFGAKQWEPKLRAAVKRQEAGERTGVRGSAQKAGSRLDCQSETLLYSRNL